MQVGLVLKLMSLANTLRHSDLFFPMMAAGASGGPSVPGLEPQMELSKAGVLEDQETRLQELPSSWP